MITGGNTDYHPSNTLFMLETCYIEMPKLKTKKRFWETLISFFFHIFNFSTYHIIICKSSNYFFKYKLWNSSIKLLWKSKDIGTSSLWILKLKRTKNFITFQFWCMYIHVYGYLNYIFLSTLFFFLHVLTLHSRH